VSPDSRTAAETSRGAPAPDAAYRLSPAEIAEFQREGILFRRGFFAADELAPLQEATHADPEIDGALAAVSDSHGNPQEVISWTELGEDLMGVLPRLARLAGAAEALLGGPVYHWHSKLSMKRPGSEGRWDWHQDYAYWYEEGCLSPNLLTCMVAVDPATRENGCVQLVRGSHRLGRLDHPRVGEASGVDPERLAQLLKTHEIVHAELEPGDAAFFHSNTLHASGPNRSSAPRTIIHFSYNRTNNSPYKPGQERHYYRPLAVLPDDTLRARRYASVFTGQEFLMPDPNAPVNSYGYKVLRHARRAVARAAKSQR
jgi:ectoine hydroxylase-related dioxygenase (phytanoyl-CoA dioxygenase family)